MRYMNESCHTHEWCMAHIWMSHGTHMNESWHTYERVMAHIWTSHGTHINESWHTSLLSSLWLTCLISMYAYHSRDDEKEIKSAFVPDTPTLMNQKALFKTYVLGKLVSTSFPSTCVHTLYTPTWLQAWVMSHVWRSHGTHMNESWHTYEWVLCTLTPPPTYVCVMAHIWMSRVYVTISGMNKHLWVMGLVQMNVCESWPWCEWMCASHGFPMCGWVMALVE